MTNGNSFERLTFSCKEEHVQTEKRLKDKKVKRERHKENKKQRRLNTGDSMVSSYLDLSSQAINHVKEQI